MKMPQVLADCVSTIEPRNSERYYAARQHLESLTKPPGSLGRLEEVAAQFFANQPDRVTLPLKKAVYVFAADHGIVAEGVSLYPQEVTAQMVHNFLSGGAAINVLARQQNAELLVIDAGVRGDFEAHPGLHRAKIASGTSNFARQPAMGEEQLARALQLGLDLAHAADKADQQLIAVGEMGIGNTTSASAIATMLTGREVKEVTGRGTGLDEPGRQKKVDVIRRALQLHFAERKPEPLELLQTVGGLEIAAMTGFILGLASHQRAIVCDGFISTAAAALAYAICPDVKNYLYAGHCSEEPGHQYLLETIGLQPILSLGMRLGEGTGAVLAMPIIEAALHLYGEMATFASAGVSTARVREAGA